MTDKKRIGLREIATLGPNTLIWDTEVSCFGARRQKSDAISYIVFYRTTRTDSAFTPLGGMEHHGRPKPHEERLSAF
jgi:hypothetical protein